MSARSAATKADIASVKVLAATRKEPVTMGKKVKVTATLAAN